MTSVEVALVFIVLPRYRLDLNQKIQKAFKAVTMPKEKGAAIAAPF
jgi:hypothetical protein